jgi:Flp pilus assembly protein TadG
MTRSSVKPLQLVALGNRESKGGERGAALVELAITLPLLVVILFGTIDFGRAFFFAMTLTNAARAGAHYGGQSVGAAIQSGGAGMIDARNAVLTANGISTSDSPAPEATCGCLRSDGTFEAGKDMAKGNCSPTTTCSASAHLVVMVTVTARAPFSMVTRFPGLPLGPIMLERGATARAQ